MKKLFLHLTCCLAVMSFSILLSNCTENESSSKIVGIWNVTSIDFSAFVGSMTVEQYYLDELGYDQEDADSALSSFEDLVTSYLISSMIEFEADYFYWTNIADPAGDDGEWSINATETVITLDAGTIWETEIIVNSLTLNALNISFEMQDEMDLDADPQTPEETVDFDMTMTLARS